MFAFKILKNKAGVSLTELMVGVGINSFILLGVSTSLLSAQKTKKIMEHRMVFMEVASQLKLHLTNPAAWALTVDNSVLNPNLACLKEA